MNIKALTAPLEPADCEWRVGQQSRNGDKISVLIYVTNRTIMNRLDEAFGWENWSNEFKEINDGFMCTIHVTLPDGRVVSKSDVASLTQVEKQKGGASSAMKRAAVHLGLGRTLYDYPKVFIETTEKYLPSWATPMLNALVIKFNSGAQLPPVVTLKQKDAANYK